MLGEQPEKFYAGVTCTTNDAYFDHAISPSRKQKAA
jgi:hypothetical protein